MNEILSMILYILGSILIIVLIVLSIKLIITMNKIENVVDDISNKVDSLNGLFSIIDFTTDKLAMISEKVTNGITLFIDKIFKINCENNNSLTFYISNKLKIERYYKDINYDNLEKKHIKVDNDNHINVICFNIVCID